MDERSYSCALDPRVLLSGMKIRSITGIPVETNLIVKIETDEGLYGVGEAGVAVQVPATMKVLEYFAEWLVGRDPLATEELWQQMFRYSRRKEGSIICAAISGIDMALWDIKGKALGVPVWQLLGGKVRDRVRLYAHIGGKDTTEVIERSRAAIERGFTALRYGFDDPAGGTVFDASRALRRSVQTMEAVREAVGPEIDICVDVHQRLSPARAVEYCRAVEPVAPLFVEDPIRPEDPSAYRSLRERVSVPLASGENLYSKWQFRPLIEEELVEYIRVDLGAAGGITESRKIAAAAETHYLEIVPHCARGPLLELATLHFSFATPNLAVQEHTGGPAWWHDVFVGLGEFESGWATAPEAPGLGVEFNEEATKAHPWVQRQMPRWRKPDGSVQEW